VTEARKARVATVSLAGCFGCHMAILDIDERLIELMKLVDFDRSPLTDKKAFTNRCDIGIIEGGCCNEENVHVLRDFRRNCDVLIAIGQCAIMGGLPAMRNAIMHSDAPLRECLEEAYITGKYIRNTTHNIPNDPALPLMLDEVYLVPMWWRLIIKFPAVRPKATLFSKRSPVFWQVNSRVFQATV